MSIQAKINQRESLEKLDQEKLYEKVIKVLKKTTESLSASDIAKRIGRKTRQDIQPRMTELKNRRNS